MFQHIQVFYLCLNITLNVCACAVCGERKNEREFSPNTFSGWQEKNQHHASFIADVWYYL